MGEPFGALPLVFAITVIEVGLIISVMMGAKGLETIILARDTVFAAVMIILTGIIGSCIVIGSLRYREQSFTLQGGKYSTHYAYLCYYFCAYSSQLYGKSSRR
ncbi:hypothetical protein [Chryseobacterium potabilaquae]|uniref:hypothetical protein n=1 Tax=Chryseobacterium potabilaquae TaxID=2675057 RepID=UPI001E4F7C50|nr:hypothetical protein [Chryseobacterium potabilaquae]